MDSYKIALEILDSNLYLALASTSAENRPWCSPLYFAATLDLEFIAISAVDSTHAANIREVGRVCWCMFWGDKAPEETDGLYFVGHGREIADMGEAQIYGDVLYDRRFSEPAERSAHPANPAFWNDTGRRLYVLTPTEVSKVDRNDPRGVSREKLDLDVLKNAHRKRHVEESG